MTRITKQQKAVILAQMTGRSIEATSKDLGISKQSLYNARHRLRLKGILKKPKKSILTPTQRNILYCYMQKQSIPDIAKSFGIHCQTVMNHATAGFERLGLNKPGVDRITALWDFFEPKPVTMDDPFFN